MSAHSDGTRGAEIAAAFERAAGRGDAAAPRGPAVTSAEPPRMSVAIASYNRREGLSRALAALARQEYPADRFEVVVVLDGSTDGSAQMVRALDTPYELRLVEQSNRGLAATRNRGAAEAAHDVVVFVDDDIYLEPRCLAEYAAAHQAEQGDALVLGVAAPRVAGSDAWSQWVVNWWDSYYARKAAADHRWTFVDVADGMASLPKRLFDESGGFDESFRERRQDWEWGIRLLRRRVALRQTLLARGDHEVDTSIDTAIRYSLQEGRSDVQLGTAHPEVRGRLPLARFAIDGSRPARLALRAPRASAAVARVVRALAVRPVRAMGRPAPLERLVGLLRAHAYVDGMLERLGSREAVEAFLAPVAGGVGRETLVVDLDAPRPLAVPPVGGELLLSVRSDGRELATVAALEPGEQWDWDALTARVVDAVSPAGAAP